MTCHVFNQPTWQATGLLMRLDDMAGNMVANTGDVAGDMAANTGDVAGDMAADVVSK
jgi:hypothetical protein